MFAGMRRYGQIADILVKHGFGIAVGELFPGLPHRLLSRGPDGREKGYSVYERIRCAIEELGPTYIKFGQIMSTRRELFPPEMIAELLRLQDQVPPLLFSEIRVILDESLPGWEEKFEYIDPLPVAAASLSQVHRGILSDGTVVAVKIQRPGIGEVIETDLLILTSLAERIERVFPDLRVFNPTGIVRDFSVQIRKELDFTRDGKNAERIRNNMSSIKGIRVPRIFWEVSSRRVLTMEFIDGVRIDDTESIRRMGLDSKDISEKGFAAYLNQIMVDGFFHGDPHPGNLLVMENGDLAFLDFGICMLLRPDRREIFIRLVHGLVTADVDISLQAFSDLGFSIPDEEQELFRDDLYLLLMDYSDYEVSQYDFSKVIIELSEMLRKYQVRVPGEFMRLMKVLGMVTEIALLLDPSFVFNRRVRPYLEEIMQEQYFSPDAIKKEIRTGISSLQALLRIPDQVNLALRRVGEGKIRVDIVADDIRRLQETIDRSTDRMTITLLISSIVIGSSLLIIASDTTIRYCGYIAFTGYAIAVIVGIYIISRAIRMARNSLHRRR
ncbi:hypothetical protein RJ53_08090 [Methanocalculus chunghsingensis]|uniref:Protein kinase domain-containing protein n=2 Tax=Methanocalculus chunghsingensis TaxID=156457 RepID=A0A8J7W849_9EURY|nr:hypothetical protein [Methanocalculus chunghsingensis]